MSVNNFDRQLFSRDTNLALKKISFFLAKGVRDQLNQFRVMELRSIKAAMLCVYMVYHNYENAVLIKYLIKETHISNSSSMVYQAMS